MSRQILQSYVPFVSSSGIEFEAPGDELGAPEDEGAASAIVFFLNNCFKLASEKQ